jgi:signal recognition particle receptor subunit alpha
MIDYACIFTTGGVVLWCKAFCDSNLLKLDIVNLFIKNVLLDDKMGSRSSYGVQDNILRWKMHSELKIVFAIVYKEILQLTMIDEFLDMIKYDFINKVWPKLLIEGDVIKTLP